MVGFVDASAGLARNAHAVGLTLRTASQRCAGHSSGASPAHDSRLGCTAMGLHHGRLETVSRDLAAGIYRMFRQFVDRMEGADGTDRARDPWPDEHQRMDWSGIENGPSRSRGETGGVMDV